MARGTSDGMLISPKMARPKPTFSVTDGDLPQIKQWEVGKKYKLDIEVEMVRHSNGNEYGEGGGKDDHEARLRITKFATEKDIKK